MQTKYSSPQNNQNKLEAMLLPIANKVSDILSTAAPIAKFEYETAETELAPTPRVEIPIAPLFPKDDPLESRLLMEERRIGMARRKGLEKAEEEKEKIAKSNMETGAINYHARKMIEEAKKEAEERDRSGVEIEQNNWFHRGKERSSRAAPKTKASGEYSNNVGYECTNYEVSGYSFGGDYEVSNYKSVY